MNSLKQTSETDHRKGESGASSEKGAQERAACPLFVPEPHQRERIGDYRPEELDQTWKTASEEDASQKPPFEKDAAVWRLHLRRGIVAGRQMGRGRRRRMVIRFTLLLLTVLWVLVWWLVNQ